MAKEERSEHLHVPHRPESLTAITLDSKGNRGSQKGRGLPESQGRQLRPTDPQWPCIPLTVCYGTAGLASPTNGVPSAGQLEAPCLTSKASHGRTLFGMAFWASVTPSTDRHTLLAHRARLLCWGSLCGPCLKIPAMGSREAETGRHLSVPTQAQPCTQGMGGHSVCDPKSTPAPGSGSPSHSFDLMLMALGTLLTSPFSSLLCPPASFPGETISTLPFLEENRPSAISKATSCHALSQHFLPKI